MSTSDSELTPELTPLIATPGSLLREARERAGLTQEYVAKELHMSLSRIKALETDDYTQLNANTFIRGYLRAYASLLKLDVASVVLAYEHHALARGLVIDKSRQSTRDSSPRKLWRFVALLISLLAGLWLISVWFFDNQVDRAVVAPSPVIMPSGSSLTALPLPENPAAEAASSSVSDQVIEAVAAASEENREGIATSSTSSSATEGATEKKLDELALIFSEECWLEVSDARGDVLATELQRAGSRLSLKGTAPFSVTLGNAAAANIALNGADVVITPPAQGKVLIINIGE